MVVCTYIYIHTYGALYHKPYRTLKGALILVVYMHPLGTLDKQLCDRWKGRQKLSGSKTQTMKPSRLELGPSNRSQDLCNPTLTYQTLLFVGSCYEPEYGIQRDPAKSRFSWANVVHVGIADSGTPTSPGPRSP